MLRLDRPGGEWQVDLETATGTMKLETLKELEFGTGTGKSVRLLFAADYVGLHPVDTRYYKVQAYVRDAVSGKWNTSIVASGRTDIPGTDTPRQSLSLRAVCVHRDRVTNAERVFMLVGTLGIFTGIFDSSLDGMIRWDPDPEPLPPTSKETRPLAVIESAGDLLVSSGRYIFRRKDGPKPSYERVYTHPGGKPVSGLGGIRGLTAIPNPNGAGESLLFLYCGAPGASAEVHGACMTRLDPDGKGGYTTHQELCLDDRVSEYLGGVKLYRLLGDYNLAYPVPDPRGNGGRVHLIGVQVLIPAGKGLPTVKQNCGDCHPTLFHPQLGFYAGGIYFLRNNASSYDIGEIGGRRQSERAVQPALSAVRTYTLSPFETAAGNDPALYFAGYDCSGVPSHDTAWVFRGELKTALTPL